MSTNTTGTVASTAGSGSRAGEFDDCVPVTSGSTKVMSEAQNTAVWGKLYAAAGIAAQAESIKKSLRCAIYVYCAKNGTSPEGSYKGNIKSGKGTELRASEIPLAAGLLDVRKFMRANGDESVRFFRATDVLTVDPEIRAKCEMYEISPSDAIALADWLDTTVGLTPTERAAANQLRNYGIDRARRSRGGKDVSEVRQDHRDAALAAQGSGHQVIAPGDVW